MNISNLLLKFSIVLAMGLVLVPCLQQGMFLDGVNYANVAQNLASGKGSIWHFTYSETFLHHYTHQLPLMLWFEAFFFWLLGDSVMVERVCCLLMLAGTAWGISCLWKESYDEYRLYYGWPLILWLATPIVFWGYANNVQELMMSLCSVWSLTYLLRYKRTALLWQLLLAGLLCFLSGFCKGVQGMFLLVAIPIHYIVVRPSQMAGMVKEQLWFILPTFLLTAALWIHMPSRQMLVANFDDRLRSTFVDRVQDTTTFRFELWVDLLAELLVPVGISAFVFMICYLFGRKAKPHWSRQSLYLMITGMSAALPLIVTMEQRRFYLITSIPFFVVAIGGLLGPMLHSVKVKERLHMLASWILVGLSLIVGTYALTKKATYKRDKALLGDVRAVAELAPGQIISADAELIYHYRLIAYLAREANISLDFEGEEERQYHLSSSGCKSLQVEYEGSEYVLCQQNINKN